MFVFKLSSPKKDVLPFNNDVSFHCFMYSGVRVMCETFIAMNQLSHHCPGYAFMRGIHLIS